MIITRTPFRISFAGGGTDIKSYYRHGYGAVVSTTINKYIYITVNKRFDDTIRVSYSKTEIVENVKELQHDIVRECLKMVGIQKGIEITSVADIPAGTGLGSSSSFTVGLLNALYTYKGQQRSAHELAEKACKIEIDILGNPIGKQDQFAAAYGGTNYYKFNNDETVEYQPMSLDIRDIYSLDKKLMMFYTGVTRNANGILKDQSRRSNKNVGTLNYIRDQADELKDTIIENGITENLAQVLHDGWMRKKTISESVSNAEINRWYNHALEAGALGGKLLGAGGGGFILIYCDEEKQQCVREMLMLREIDFRLTNHGSRVVYIGED